jgi:hypothetical protein
MHINAKLGTMRKSVQWSVYPQKKDGRIVIQSNKRIAVFHDDGSNKGLLSKSCPSGAYFLHLSKACGATDVDIPQDVIDAALEAQPVSGDKIGPGVFVA